MFWLHGKDLLSPEGFNYGQIFNDLLTANGYWLEASLTIGEETVNFSQAVLLETLRRKLLPEINMNIEISISLEPIWNPILVVDKPGIAAGIADVVLLITNKDVLNAARDLEPDFPESRLRPASSVDAVCSAQF